MMIFDRFRTPADAEAFAQAAQNITQEPSITVHNWEDFEKYDVFPYELVFPVVLVPRLDTIEAEEAIEALVDEFRGEFAGT